MMNWQIIDLAQTTPSPWKNSGGVTRELVAWPDAANWDWRMSVAEVASDGAFSCFDGVHRWFVVLSGNGVQLQMEDAVHTLTTASEPFGFDGAASVDCTLISGATQDFNLMTRNSKANASMRRLSGKENLTIDTSKIIALYAINTPATVKFGVHNLTLKPGEFAWCNASAGAVLGVDAASALWMEITECN